MQALRYITRKGGIHLRMYFLFRPIFRPDLDFTNTKSPSLTQLFNLLTGKNGGQLEDGVKRKISP